MVYSARKRAVGLRTVLILTHSPLRVELGSRAPVGGSNKFGEMIVAEEQPQCLERRAFRESEILKPSVAKLNFDDGWSESMVALVQMLMPRAVELLSLIHI